MIFYPNLKLASGVLESLKNCSRFIISFALLLSVVLVYNHTYVYLALFNRREANIFPPGSASPSPFPVQPPAHHVHHESTRVSTATSTAPFQQVRAAAVVLHVQIPLALPPPRHQPRIRPPPNIPSLENPKPAPLLPATLGQLETSSLPIPMTSLAGPNLLYGAFVQRHLP